MSPNRFTTGKTADGLIYHCLENGSSQVLFRSSVIDQGLDICFGKNTASGCNGIKGLIIFCIFVQPWSVCLKERRHLVDEGTGTAGTDAVHALFYVASFKVNDLGVFASQLNGNICFWSHFLKRSGYGDNFLNKRNLQMISQGQTSGTGDHRGYLDFT